MLVLKIPLSLFILAKVLDFFFLMPTSIYRYEILRMVREAGSYNTLFLSQGLSGYGARRCGYVRPRFRGGSEFSASRPLPVSLALSPPETTMVV